VAGAPLLEGENKRLRAVRLVFLFKQSSLLPVSEKIPVHTAGFLEKPYLLFTVEGAAQTDASHGSIDVTSPTIAFLDDRGATYFEQMSEEEKQVTKG
jgi:hypothetical protein